jgi:hypothetical protein
MEGMSPRVLVAIAPPGALGGLISAVGVLGVFARLAWRFGATLLRVTGWCSWWGAWACGQRGYD